MGGYRGRAEGQSVNWRRGFARAWIAVSVAWIGVVAWIFYTRILGPRHAASECAATRTKNPSLGNPFDCFDLVPIGVDMVDYATAALIPVIVLGGLGVAVAWILRGFRSN